MLLLGRHAIKACTCCIAQRRWTLIQVSKRELLAVQTSKATLNRLLARVRRLTEVNLYRKPNVI